MKNKGRVIELSNHAIQRWFERFYGWDANILQAFLGAKKLNKNEEKKIRDYT